MIFTFISLFYVSILIFISIIRVILNIKLAIYDFDGVMTDNTAMIDSQGNEFVKVNRSDGLGINMIRNLGIEQIIVSTERNDVVIKRALKLKIPCYNDITDKLNEVKAQALSRKVELENVAFIGNDVNDKEAMMAVGYPLCPSDAYQEIKDISIKILPSNGGGGVIRDFFDFLEGVD